MSNFIIRTLSGIVYAALVLGAIFAGPVYFALLSFIFLIFTLREFYTITNDKNTKINPGLLYAVNILLFLVGAGFLFLGYSPSYLLLILTIPFLSMIYILVNEISFAFLKSGKLLISLVYLSIPLIIMVFLFYPSGNFSEAKIYPLIGLFSIIWISDTMAYISGSLIGRTKLFERLSPGKTWEGSIGGLLFSLLGAWILSIFFTELSLTQWMGFAIITVIFGTFGDLFESMLKRHAGIKESGNLMPGHGGFLDRLDSLLFASPMVYLYLMIILNL